MTTITQKRKLSASTWIMIIVAFAVLIGVIVASAFGLINLSWIGDGFLGAYIAVSQSLILAVLMSIGWIALGFITCYVIFTYFRGQKVTTTGQPGYSPVPTYPSQPVKSDTETKIS